MRGTRTGKTCAFYLTDVLIQTIDGLAKDSGLSRSEVVSRLIVYGEQRFRETHCGRKKVEQRSEEEEDEGTVAHRMEVAYGKRIVFEGDAPSSEWKPVER